MSDTEQTFSSRLRKTMEENSFTQKELSAQSKISENVISAYLQGKKYPTAEDLFKLASTLETSMDYLWSVNAKHANNESNKYLPYLRLYLYVTEIQLRNIIETGTLYVSLPWNTNDITEGVQQNETRQKEEIRPYGYICLSGTCTSPAMWGYYADRSRGACLSFSFIPFTIEDRIHTDRVPSRYEELPPFIKKVIYRKKRASSEDIDELLFLKSEDWKHEDEYRMKIPLSSCDVEEINKQIVFKNNHLIPFLRGIILGANCSLEIAEVKGLLSLHKKTKISQKTVVIKSKMNQTHFNFDVDMQPIYDAESIDYFDISPNTSSSSIRVLK